MKKKIQYNNNDIIKDLEKEFYTQLKEKGWKAYLKLSENEQDKLDKNFYDWNFEKDPIHAILFGRDYPLCMKKFYLAERLLKKNEHDFEKWAQVKGYKVIQVGKEYQVVS